MMTILGDSSGEIHIKNGATIFGLKVNNRNHNVLKNPFSMFYKLLKEATHVKLIHGFLLLILNEFTLKGEYLCDVLKFQKS